MKYDVVIVGAGIPGCCLAEKIALAGYKVALLDARPIRKIGNLWEINVDKNIFNFISKKYPPDKLLIERADEIVFFAKDINENVKIEGSKFNTITILHRVLNKTMLKSALNSNVDFYPKHNVIAPVLDNDYLTGVTGYKKLAAIPIPFKVSGRIIIDCTGVKAVLRKKVPDSFNIKKDIQAQDYASAWQETWTVKDNEKFKLNEGIYAQPGTNYTKVGKYHAYTFLHLRKNNTINMVFGASIVKSDLAYFICKEYKNNLTSLNKCLHADGGIIPIRRSLDNFVGNGFLLLGDSACQLIPTIGSGIQPSLLAAQLASKTIIKALNNNNYSKESLWQYNFKYQQEIGAVLASYDIIRRFLQSINTHNMNEIFKSG
ncbi:NAD(P)/FAD-dependent oxidoreductase, partial [Spirochaetota bacterium]